MATTIYGSVGSYVEWWFPTKSGTVMSSDPLYYYPYPDDVDVPAGWQNKVWDDVAGGWVHWVTDYPDVGGQSYPGPGIFGTDTSLFGVEARVFGRHERV